MPGKARGFTLLEALVAMFLVASVGMALLSWVNSIMIGLQRSEAALQREQAINNALAFCAKLNPMLRPNGQEDMVLYQLSWRSSLLESTRQNITGLGVPGLYKVGLYQLDVEISSPQGEEIARFQVRQMGYEQTEDLNILGTDNL